MRGRPRPWQTHFESRKKRRSRGNSSIGRAPAFQAEGCGFKPRLPLQIQYGIEVKEVIRCRASSLETLEFYHTQYLRELGLWMCHIKTMQYSNENIRRLQASVQAKAQSQLQIAGYNESEAGKAAPSRQG